MSDAKTRGIRITVRSDYVEERSVPTLGRFFFAYHVRITNEGTEAARLLSRRWVITDGFGRVETVEGPGVVGETPSLDPGASFEYSSFCPLGTPFGTMEGHYVMRVASTGETFEARIGRFELNAPSAVN